MSEPSTESAPPTGTRLESLMGSGRGVVRMADADVGSSRELRRRSRWVKLTVVVWLLVAALWLRAITYDGDGFVPLPTIDPFLLVIIVFFGLLIALMLGVVFITLR